MNLGSLKISPFVLALEMAACFAPLTLGWMAVMFDPSGVAWLDVATVEQYYLGTTAGIAMLAKMLVGAAVGLLGPLGLIVAFRHIALGRTLRRGFLSVALIGGPLVLAAVYVIANLVSRTEFSLEWGGFYVLFVTLPIVGAVHLLHLGDPSPDAGLVAR